MKQSRRQFLQTTIAAAGALSIKGLRVEAKNMTDNKPNVLFIMCDQLRFDSIAALGNEHIYTPNIDRLVRRGVTFTRAYSTCPVCVAARYTIRTGCEPPRTGVYSNMAPDIVEGQSSDMEERCGPFLARAMSGMGYRTFGIGKFHTVPNREDIGYETQEYSEELYADAEDRKNDHYAEFIRREHPEYAWVEQLMGERSEMYYMPQMSVFPAEIAVEAWAAERAIKHIEKDDGRPYFGFVSFVGPHPPLAPPIPFNRMYDPERMPDPVTGEIDIDHMDEYLPFMNYLTWSEDVDRVRTRSCRARYYGEITYIDLCLGKILDAVESRPDADNTVICFFADHGDHLGDHHAWQKESFFEEACRVPFLVSWPAKLPRDERRGEFACLADLFGIATSAAGNIDKRDGTDLLGVLEGRSEPRKRVVGYHELPGRCGFKMMVREGDWKYIFLSNGGREQLFNLADDPHELMQMIYKAPDATARLRAVAIEETSDINISRALENGKLKVYEFQPMPRMRLHQFDMSHGIVKFPDNPRDVLKENSAN